jgi:HAMP domain-containing protein
MIALLASVSGTPAVLTLATLALVAVLAVVVWSWLGYRRSRPHTQATLRSQVSESARSRSTS